MQQANQGEFKPFNAAGWRLGIVVAQFNKHITDQLKQSAIMRADDYNIAAENIVVINVAGAVEIPLVLQNLAKTGKYDALLAVGCVIKGTTPHFEYVCNFVTEGILQVQLNNNMPVGFGVLTCNNEPEAQERAHLGGEHLDAVMNQAQAIHSLKNL